MCIQSQFCSVFSANNGFAFRVEKQKIANLHQQQQNGKQIVKSYTTKHAYNGNVKGDFAQKSVDFRLKYSVVMLDKALS